MSHRFYHEKWQKVQKLLFEACNRELPQLDRREHRPQLAELYLRYIVIANKLSDCVDQLVQPQKRDFVRKLLELILGRIIELKYDLVEGDLCEYTYVGDTMDKLKLTTETAELKVPRCFTYERREELTNRKRTMDDILEKLGFLEQSKDEKPMSDIQAIILLQSHERARQGRLRSQFMKEIRMLKEKSKPTPVEEDDRVKIGLVAAVRIQKMWRGYMARRMTRRRKLQEMLLIGMLPPPYKKSEEIEDCQKIFDQRLHLQELRQSEYEQATEGIKEKLSKTQRGPLLEQLGDQVRGWLHEYKEQTGKIPEYTGSERSASRLLMSRQGTDSELSKSTEKSSKESKTKKSKGDKMEKQNGGKDEEEEDTKALISNFLTEITQKNEEYDEMWKNRDETINPEQKFYEEIVVNEQMGILENELRKVVDEMMRNELQMLQDAWDRDRGTKTRKPKKSSKKSRGKKSKKKKEKDLTPDRTTESLFEELVANGIIRKYEEAKLSDFIGERHQWNAAEFNKGPEPEMAIGDLRQLMVENCIIPLCSQNIHENTPLVRSILIAGFRGCGKDLLVRAICTEMGAVLFDLTPANIVGKYPGKSGLTMLLHLVNKVSRLLQPSIIFMDSAEKPFMKKTAKGDKTDPKRLKKDLPKLVKGICPEDRVMMIGISHCPWESDQKLLFQVYQKYLVIPKPDYVARYSMWKYLLGEYKAIGWQFDIGLMAKISDGYTLGTIKSVVQEVMTCKRVLQLRVHPLNPAELVNVLATRVPIYREEEEALMTWYSKTPMFKKRTRAIEIRAELERILKEKEDMFPKKKEKKPPEEPPAPVPEDAEPNPEGADEEKAQIQNLEDL